MSRKILRKCICCRKSDIDNPEDGRQLEMGPPTGLQTTEDERDDIENIQKYEFCFLGLCTVKCNVVIAPI